MKYDYYLHKSLGYIDDYFGDIGKPFKISFLKYCMMKKCGYKTTKVPAGSSLKVVLTQALINNEIPLESMAAEKLFEKFKEENENESG